jgi:HEPN domain-containing protein
MREREKVITVVGEWVEKAENDLKNAAHTLKMGADCPTDTVCFHAQQVVEKYLKALLVLRGISFPKIHNIEELVALLPAADRPKLSDAEQDRLTDYATVTRYPGDYEPIPLAEARRFVAIARRARMGVRKRLPKEALSRGRRK